MTGCVLPYVKSGKGGVGPRVPGLSLAFDVGVKLREPLKRLRKPFPLYRRRVTWWTLWSVWT